MSKFTTVAIVVVFLSTEAAMLAAYSLNLYYGVF